MLGCVILADVKKNKNPALDSVLKDISNALKEDAAGEGKETGKKILEEANSDSTVPANDDETVVSGMNPDYDYSTDSEDSDSQEEQKPKQSIVSIVSDFYYSFEDRYYDLLDKVDEKIPIYNVIDPIDRFFPSFILLLFLALAGILAVLALGIPAILSLLSPKIVVFKVLDEKGSPIEGVSLAVTQLGKTSSFSTDAFGIAEVELLEKTILLEARKEGYKDYNESVTPEMGVENEITLLTEVKASMVNIKVVDDSTSNPVSVPVDYSFSCSAGKNYAPPAIINRGSEIDVTVLFGCNMLSVTASAEGYDAKSSSLINVRTAKSSTIRLKKKQVFASLTVMVYDYYENSAVANASVKLKKKQGNSFVDTGQDSFLDDSGTARFDNLPIGTYYAVAEADGYKTTEPEDGEVVLRSGDDESIRLGMVPLVSPKKIMLKIVDSKDSKPIGDAVVRIFRKIDSNNYDMVYRLVSSSAGIIEESSVDSDYNYSAVVYHKNYVTKVVDSVNLIGKHEATSQVINLTKVASGADCNTASECNSGGIIVFVESYGDNKPVYGAAVNVYFAEYAFPIELGVTGEDGYLDFNNLEPGEYYAMASKGNEEGKSETETLVSGGTLELTITLVTSSQDVSVEVKDAGTKRPVEGALVSFFDAATNEKLEDELLTDNRGTVKKSIRMDKKIYVRVQKANEYIPYTTIPYDVSDVKKITVFLYRETDFSDINLGDAKFDIEFYAVYDEDSGKPKTPDSGKIASKLSTNKNYWVRFRVITLDDNYSDFYSVVRAGLQDNINVEDGNVTILDARFTGAGIFSSACYDPSDDYADCSPVPLSGGAAGAKQVVFYRNSLPYGMYDLYVKMQIGDIPVDAIPTTPIELRYGAKASDSDGETLFKPVSGLYLFRAVLGESICGMMAADCPISFNLLISHPELMPIPRVLGIDDIEDLLIGEDYTIDYELYNPTENNFPDSVLAITDVIGDSTPAIDLFDLDLGAPGNQTKIGIPIGDFGKGITALGSMTFKTIGSSEGARLLFDLNLGREDSFSEEEFVIRQATDLEIIPNPQKLVENIANRIRFRVKSGSEYLSGSRVKIFLGDEFGAILNPFDQITDEYGGIYFDFPAAAAGTSYYVTAEKPGYNDGNLLLVVEPHQALMPGAKNCVSLDKNSLAAIRGSSVDFTVKNENCGGNVSIMLAVQGDSDIYLTYASGGAVSQAFELSEGEDKKILVNTVNMLGTHPVYVYAKTASDFEDLLANIVDVNIIDASSCFQLKDSQTYFDLYNNDGKADLNMYNNCWHALLANHSDDEHMEGYPDSTQILMDKILEAEAMGGGASKKLIEYLLEYNGISGTSYVPFVFRDYVCGETVRGREIPGSGCS